MSIVSGMFRLASAYIFESKPLSLGSIEENKQCPLGTVGLKRLIVHDRATLGIRIKEPMYAEGRYPFFCCK
jgi:hypothetical protein